MFSLFFGSFQGQLEDHGPFKSLSKLWEHNAHLAVFMNYVISNSDPSSLVWNYVYICICLFYLNRNCSDFLFYSCLSVLVIMLNST